MPFMLTFVQVRQSQSNVFGEGEKFTVMVMVRRGRSVDGILGVAHSVSRGGNCWLFSDAEKVWKKMCMLCVVIGFLDRIKYRGGSWEYIGPLA